MCSEYKPVFLGIIGLFARTLCVIEGFLREGSESSLPLTSSNVPYMVHLASILCEGIYRIWYISLTGNLVCNPA
jgi:hypothetical protein